MAGERESGDAETPEKRRFSVRKPLQAAANGLYQPPGHPTGWPPRTRLCRHAAVLGCGWFRRLRCRVLASPADGLDCGALVGAGPSTRRVRSLTSLRRGRDAQAAAPSAPYVCASVRKSIPSRCKSYDARTLPDDPQGKTGEAKLRV